MYLSLAQFTPPSFGKTRLHIQRLQVSAERLLSELRRHHGKPRSAFDRAHILIDWHYSGGDGRSVGKTAQLEKQIKSYIAACKQAPASLKRVKKLEPVAWKFWIANITLTLHNKYGLPVAVRKDTDKRGTRPPSPFVRLVWELQHRLPAKYRRSMSSIDALAVAIVKVRAATIRVLD
jgi:hypothetical protein